MTRVDWASHPAVRKIDIRKLSVLMALEQRLIRELLPSLYRSAGTADWVWVNLPRMFTIQRFMRLIL